MRKWKYPVDPTRLSGGAEDGAHVAGEAVARPAELDVRRVRGRRRRRTGEGVARQQHGVGAPRPQARRDCAHQAIPAQVHAGVVSECAHLGRKRAVD